MKVKQMKEPSITQSKPKKSFVQRLFAFSPSGLVKLILACLGVGIVLAILNIDPRRVWSDFFGTISDAWAKGWEMADWAVDYLLLGAILVVPVFIILRVLSAVGKKS
jgi:TM2 domain-containing membrane protein YozV